MSAPVSLLQGARAFARDFARDAMPRGYLWDIFDFVPTLIDTQLTGRGAWLWGSATQGGGDWIAGMLAPFASGEQILGTVTGTQLYQVGSDPPYALTSRGTVYNPIQNPIMLNDETIWFDGGGGNPPRVVKDTGAPVAVGSGAPNAKVGAIWRAYCVCGGAPANPARLYFSPPQTTLTAWDAASIYDTSAPITGLAGLRSLVLIFHAGSVERLRGTIPVHTGFTNADIVIEPLFNQVGTTEPKTICYWNENVIFADEHGVHMTDGSAIRNLISQGGISYYWRPLYQNKQTIAAAVFLDYYIISVVRTDGITITLVCDLNKRQWFKFSNIPALSIWGSSGTRGMERVWAGIKGTQRLARIGPCFFPALDGTTIVDDNGVNVLPSFETPWYRLGQEGRKRVRFAYLSYDARIGITRDLGSMPSPARAGYQVEDVELPTDAQPFSMTPAALELSYIYRSPQDPAFTVAGSYPSTDRYQRYRVPVGKFPHGVAFRVAQKLPTTVTRIFDLAVDAHGAERSRV